MKWILVGAAALAGTFGFWWTANAGSRAEQAFIEACKAEIEQRAFPAVVRYASVTTTLSPATSEDVEGDHFLRSEFLQLLEGEDEELMDAVETLSQLRRERWQEGATMGSVLVRHSEGNLETGTICSTFGPKGADWADLEPSPVLVNGLTIDEWRTWRVLKLTN